MRPMGYQKTPFTRALWDKWLARLNADDPYADRLREGIEELRARLQKRYLNSLRKRA